MPFVTEFNSFITHKEKKYFINFVQFLLNCLCLNAIKFLRLFQLVNFIKFSTFQTPFITFEKVFKDNKSCSKTLSKRYFALKFINILYVKVYIKLFRH